MLGGARVGVAWAVAELVKRFAKFLGWGDFGVKCWFMCGMAGLLVCGVRGENFANRRWRDVGLAACEEIGFWAVFGGRGINEIRMRFRKPRGWAKGRGGLRRSFLEGSD